MINFVDFFAGSILSFKTSTGLSFPFDRNSFGLNGFKSTSHDSLSSTFVPKTYKQKFSVFPSKRKCDTV